MPNYKSMYLALFNTVTDSITSLQNAQLKAEEMAMQEKNNPLCITQKQDKEEM